MAKRTAVPTVEARPYMVVKPHQDIPQYRASFKSAQDLILRDLQGIKHTYQSLLAKDSLLAIDGLEQQAERLPDSGGVVAGVFDPETGLRYSAEIVKRTEMS